MAALALTVVASNPVADAGAWEAKYDAARKLIVLQRRRAGAFADEVTAQWQTLYETAIHWTNHNPEEAEDLVQDTMLRAIKKQDSFTRGTNLKAWLVTIMRNRWIDLFRQGKRGRGNLDIDGLAEVLTDGRDSVVETAIASQTIEEALALVREMPDYYLDVLRMVVLEDLTYAEAAEKLGIPLGTAMSGVFRARQKLRAHFADDPARLRILALSDDVVEEA